MAERDDRSDIDKLLAETEAVLGAGERAPAPRHNADVQNAPRNIASRLRLAALTAVPAAAAVWVIFAFLPFLGATSGAAGAFLAAFVAVALLRGR